MIELPVALRFQMRYNPHEPMFLFPFTPGVYFYLVDLAFAVCIYGISIVLFLTYRRGRLGPMLFLGLFIFPLQFSIWFLQSRISLTLPINLLEVVYLLFDLLVDGVISMNTNLYPVLIVLVLIDD